MMKLKKLLFLWSACLLTTTLGVATACGGNNKKESSDTLPSSDSTVSDTTGDSSATDSTGNVSSENGDSSDSPAEKCEHINWSVWEATKTPTCTEVGEKVRYCQADNCNFAEYAEIALRPHDYTHNNGVCICGAGPILPEEDPSPVYVDPTDPDSGILGAGEQYNRYEITEGYYQITFATTQTLWLSCSALSAGQYAMYTIDSGENAALTRYDANAHFIPSTGYEARVLESGELYAVVSASTQDYSTDWRATYALQGNAGTTVKFRFEKIAEPVWSPKYLYETITATQINGVTAAEGAKNTELAEVPYNSTYFYDEETGYYRLGSKDAPGEIIYAAISKIAPRMMQGVAFTDLLKEGAPLRVAAPQKTTAEGDYLVWDYTPFIMSDVTYGGSPDNSYQAFANSEGLYPVTQELFQFLNLYVAANRPANIDDSIWNDESKRNTQAWLAACFYYSQLTPGDINFPVVIGVGDSEVTLPIRCQSIYYTLKYQTPDSSSVISYCTLSCRDTNVVLLIGNKTYYGPFDVVVATDNISGTNFALQANAYATATHTFTLTVSAAAEGTLDSPSEITQTGVTTMSTLTLHNQGGELAYEGYYSYTATANGTLTFTESTDMYIVVDGDYVNETLTIEVTNGQTVVIQVYATDAPMSANVTITFTETTEE